MHDFLKLHHNWDAYVGVQKEWKSTFLTAFEQREKEARSLFAAQYWYRSSLWMSLSTESSISNTIPRYLYWSTDFTYWPPNFNNGVSVLFALLASIKTIYSIVFKLAKSSSTTNWITFALPWWSMLYLWSETLFLSVKNDLRPVAVDQHFWNHGSRPKCGSPRLYEWVANGFV